MKKKFYKNISRSTFDFIYDDSPIELIDKTDCYDIDTFEYFLVVRMRNVSSRKIASVDARVSLYSNSNVPYKKIDHTYIIPKSKKGEQEDIIGSEDHIPLPQTFYTKMDFSVLSVTFKDGETMMLNLSSSQKPKLIQEQSHDIVTACEIVDDKEGVKENFPAIIFPQFGRSAWICCCSNKNKYEDEECRVCGRHRDVLKEIYSHENLSRVARNEIAGTFTMTQRMEKANFLEKQTPKVIDEKKEQLIEDQKKKVEARERYKEKMRIQALPRIALYFVLAYLLYFMLNWIFGLVPQ